jgi:hypothetical protein
LLSYRRFGGVLGCLQLGAKSTDTVLEKTNRVLEKTNRVLEKTNAYWKRQDVYSSMFELEYNELSDEIKFRILFKLTLDET